MLPAVFLWYPACWNVSVLTEVRSLQACLCMSDAQLLLLARQVCGCSRLNRVEDLLACETLELLEDLRYMAMVAV